MGRIRRWVQLLVLLVTNGNWAFPWTRNIYQGPLKVLCSPGLNCYSCPASTTFCPVGALQQLLLGVRYSLESGKLYIGSFVVGCTGILAVTFGRFICGWGCPFGLYQELLYKLPTRKLSVPGWSRWVKYGVLAVLVVVLPLVVVDQFGMGKPWFCKYICPAGTLEAGLPMVVLMPELRRSLGWLYVNKIVLLVLFSLWSVFASRPFCRTTCPLGAFYGLFNRLSIIRLSFNAERCTHCGACHRVCPVEMHFDEAPGSAECVNCCRCLAACNFEAIGLALGGRSVGSLVQDREDPVRTP